MKIDRAGFMRYNGGALKAAPKERISYMIGIIGAMEIEVAGITAALTDHKTETLCGVTFHTGKLNGTDVVAAKCGVGKVNAAMCTAAMILSYAPSVVINTGVAGGIGEGVKIGNMVVASHTVQYDYDTTASGEPKGFLMIGSEGVVQLPTSAQLTMQCSKEYAELSTTARFGRHCDRRPLCGGSRLLFAAESRVRRNLLRDGDRRCGTGVRGE